MRVGRVLTLSSNESPEVAMSKGDDAERKLSNRLEDDYDYAAMPAGGSGTGTTRPRPDVFAVKGVRLDTPTDGLQDYSDAYAIEVKAYSDGTGSFTNGEIDALEAFAGRAGATPLVAIKPDLRTHDNWYLQNAGDLHETADGNFSIRQQDWPDCKTIPEVFSQ